MLEGIFPPLLINNPSKKTTTRHWVNLKNGRDHVRGESVWHNQ